MLFKNIIRNLILKEKAEKREGQVTEEKARLVRDFSA